ncbi:MAG: hypothetical protein PHX38_11795 [Sulfuricella sp.]|nr:hypothetical protein [Sulfuricella sp.]
MIKTACRNNNTYFNFRVLPEKYIGFSLILDAAFSPAFAGDYRPITTRSAMMSLSGRKTAKTGPLFNQQEESSEKNIPPEIRRGQAKNGRRAAGKI